MSGGTTLVTAGSGFIGTWVLRDLLEAGKQVIALDVRPATVRWNNAGTGHAGVCEMSYTPTRDPDGRVPIARTPHGVGGARKPPVFLQPGDSVTIEIDGIGRLTNPVIAEGE